MLSLADIDHLGAAPGKDVPCPICGPEKSAAGRAKRVLRVWRIDDHFATYHCARCGAAGYASDGTRGNSETRRRAVEANDRRQRANAQRKQAMALTIWREARHPLGTPVATYLESRGLLLPDDEDGALRFHPRCLFGDRRLPAMVALVRCVRTNAPLGIHRTPLLPDGSDRDRTVDRMMLGPCQGGAVKLTADEDVTLCLGVAEGIETALSMQRTCEFGLSPVWALLSAGQIERFPVLPGIETLWIAEDADPVGRRAAATCAVEWSESGVEVRRFEMRREGRDLNDVIRERYGT
jgi:putative DNA primase/helicase